MLLDPVDHTVEHGPESESIKSRSCGGPKVDILSWSTPVVSVLHWPLLTHKELLSQPHKGTLSGVILISAATPLRCRRV